MAFRSLWKIALLLVIGLTACAPDNLDITPTAVPTAIPVITVYVTGAVNETGKTVELPIGSRVQDAIDAAGGAAENADLQRVNLAQVLLDGVQINVPAVGEVVAEATPEATAAPAAVAPERALLEHIVASLPGDINAGTISWRRDNNVPVNYVDREGGVTGRVTYTATGGGLMELTFGVFQTAEQASAYYENVRTTLRTLERSEQRDQFPTPNAFGGGTYGSDAIFVRDIVFIRVSVPQFSSTAGDPLNPMARLVFPILDAAQASFGT